MGFSFSVLDPTGDNYLGLGKTVGRVVGDLPFVGTWGLGEFARPDPFGAKRNTTFAKASGGAVTGGVTGAEVGFGTGGPFGAVVGGVIGAVGGGVAGATGATNNYTPLGFIKNLGIGVGAGLTGGGIAKLSSLSTSGTWSVPKVPSFGVTNPFKDFIGIATSSAVISNLFKKSPNLSGLLPQNPGVSVSVPNAPASSVPANPASSTPPANPGFLGASPLATPNGTAQQSSPAVIIAPNQAPAAPTKSFPWWVLVVAGAVIFFIYHKKKRKH